MTDRSGIKALIVSLALVPLAASAGQGEDVRAWLELGAGAASHGNGRFGEFREPLRDDALFGLGALGITWRDALDPYRSARLVAESSLPGLALDADYRRQGEYQIGFDYRHFESLSREDYTTVFPTRGTDLVLPPGYGGAAGAERFRGDAGVRRESGNLELQRQLGAWRLRADLGRDLKEGSRILGASERFGDAALLAAPIDQRHDTLDLGAQYLGEGWRVNTAWYYSSFSNDARFLSYQNPINLAAPVRTLDTGPDNEFSRVSVDGSYQFSPTRQLSWFVAQGEARQNEDFLQPLVVAGQPLVASLDARRVDRDLRLGYRGRVNPRLDYRLQWDYRERDNRGQPLLYAANTYSHLYDQRRQRLKADAGYRLPGRMRVRGGLELTSLELTTRAGERFTDEVDGTRLWSELRMPAIGPLNWTLAVETNGRDNSLSHPRLTALDTQSPSQALPDYLLAGRDRQYQVRGDLPLGDTVLVAASYRYRKDDFDNDYFGLRQRTSDEYTLSLSWQASRHLALGAHGLYQDFRLAQDGLEFNPTSAPSHANARWRQTLVDDSKVLAVNLNWQLRPTLAATLDLSHSDNDSSYRNLWLEDADTGERAGSSDHLPGYGVDVLRLDAALAWDYSPRTRVKFRYLYERFNSSDWAWEEGDFNRLAFAWHSPNHSAHGLLVAVRYQLR